MNRRTEGLTIPHAIDGFVKYKVVEGLSERTLESYSDHLNRFQGHVGDLPMAEITAAEVEDFLYWLRTEYIPKRLNSKQKPLSNKTLYNIWVTLKSFFSWALGGDLSRLTQWRPCLGRSSSRSPLNHSLVKRFSAS